MTASTQRVGISLNKRQEKEPERHRPLKIALNAVKRLEKELECHKSDMKSQQSRIDKLKENGADEYDIRKQEEVLKEIDDVIPEVEKTLDGALETLRKRIDEAKLVSDYDKELVEEAEKKLQDTNEGD